MKPYELRIDSSRQRLDIVQRGFWSDEIFDGFAGEFATALRTLHARDGCLVALVDASEFKVQARPILLRFKALLRDLAPLCARRTATLVPAELNRMQAQLASESIRARTFTDRAAAEAWLAELGADRPARGARA
jgi:hypothetical protein